MTSKWMGALLATAALLTPLAAEAQASLRDLGSIAVAASHDSANQDRGNRGDRGDRRGGGGGGWGGRGGGGGGGGGWGGRQDRGQTPSAQPSQPSAPQWQGRRGGGFGNGGGQVDRMRVPSPDQAPRWQGRQGGDWQGRRGGDWQARDRAQPPVVAPQPQRGNGNPVADGWRGQRWQGDNRGDVGRGNADNRGRYDGRQWDRNRDGNVDRRWDRNDNGRVDRRFDRDRDGRNDRSDRFDNRRYDGRQWDRNRDGQVDRRWDRNDNGRVDRRFDRDRDGRNDRFDRFDNRRNGIGRGDFGRGQWNNRWRDDRRYDWRGFRNRNASLFRLGRYYSPYNNWSYRRLNIGFSLWPLFYSDRYWINDPGYFSLPNAFGPYRWVRYFDDALLVDVQSGEVVDVINNFFW